MDKTKFYVSQIGGELCARDTGRIVRAIYSRVYPACENGAQFRATLRAGLVAWPGGYAGAFLMTDGGIVCAACARAELRQMIHAIRTRANDGWRPDSIAWEHECDETGTCDHCGRDVLNAGRTNG